MLKDLFSNRLFIGALAFFVLMIVGGTLYLRHIQRQDQIALERTQEQLKQWKAQQKQTPKVPEGDTSQGGHFHSDGTWHDQPHETPAVTPEAAFESLSDAELAEIPEDMPEPDVPLPADLSDIKVVNRWTEKYTAEWQKYVHALNPRMERLSAEIDQMTAELPPENAPEFAAAKARLLAKKQEHHNLAVEKNARVHKWMATTDNLFADNIKEK